MLMIENSSKIAFFLRASSARCCFCDGRKKRKILVRRDRDCHSLASRHASHMVAADVPDGFEFQVSNWYFVFISVFVVFVIVTVSADNAHSQFYLVFMRYIR